MANTCSNTLRVYSENPKNLEYVKSYFKEWGNTDIEDFSADGGNLEIYFDSKWCFPDKEMKEFVEGLPDKNDISMTCLSVEWGCLYCAFYTFEEGDDDWVYCD